MPSQAEGNNPAARGQVPAPRSSEPARAYDTLKRMILANELQPGANILLEPLAAQLAMSRTPVREALIRLEQEGLLEIIPRHGMRVRPLSVDDMREIYELLTALESLAARLAAERGLEQSALAEMSNAIDDMDVALAQDDLEAWAAADARFHSLLVANAGNKRLANAVAGVLDQSHRARRITLRLRRKPINSNKDHRAVLQAIRHRDGETAYAIHHRHRASSGAMLLALLDKLKLGVM